MSEGVDEGPSRCDLVRFKVNPASTGLSPDKITLVFKQGSQVIFAFGPYRFIRKIASVCGRSTRSGRALPA